MTAIITPIRPGADRPLGNTPAERLGDQDSQAHQVRAFLESVRLFRGTYLSDAVHDGQYLVTSYVTVLAERGDNADCPLAVSEVAKVLRFMSSIEARDGVEDYAAGGTATCGHLLVLSWVAGQIERSAVAS